MRRCSGKFIRKKLCRKVDKQIYFLSITLSLTVFTCWVINRIDIFDGFHYIHVVFLFDTQEIPVALVSVPCRRLRACDATPDAPCICGKPWARQRQRQRLRSCPSCRRSASRWPVAVLGPGARLPSALPLHLREWWCRLEVGAIIVLVLARASPHHASYAYARHPQTIGWGHRRGGHQQLRTHEHECLVGADGQDDKDAVGTLGRWPRTTSRLGMAVEFAVMGPLNSCRAPTFSVAHGPMNKLSTRRWGLSSHSGHIYT